jgi:hypothetical protein
MWRVNAARLKLEVQLPFIPPASIRRTRYLRRGLLPHKVCHTFGFYFAGLYLVRSSRQPIPCGAALLDSVPPSMVWSGSTHLYILL